MTKTLRYWQDLIKKSFKIWYLNKILQELNKILILISILQDSYKISTWEASQTGNTKNPPLNRLSKYKPPRGVYLENCPQIQSKTKQKL